MSDMRGNAPACVRARQLLDGWLDGELDSATGNEVTQHVAQCQDCAALRAGRERLRASLRAAAPRIVAPARLRQSVLRALQAGASQHAAHVGRGGIGHRHSLLDARSRASTGRVIAWWKALGIAGVASVATALVTAILVRAPPDDGANEPLAEQVVTRHVASLAGGHLIDVRSSDSHVVKPWFQGKIDFAPTVRDLSRQGFVLLGARRERVMGRPGAAVVYKLRDHPVNLFIWRAMDGRDSAPTLAMVRGFSVGVWSSGGLNFAAVSDLESSELERFVRELHTPR